MGIMIFFAIGFTIGYILFGFGLAWTHILSLGIAVVAVILWLAVIGLLIKGDSSDKRPGSM